MEITITILKLNIMGEVATATAYAGAKGDSADPARFYERIATVKEDGELLDRYWREGCSRIAGFLKDFVTDIAANDENLTMTLSLSGSFDKSLLPSLESDLTEALIADMTGNWMRLSVPEMAASKDNERKSALASALAKLYHRKPPKRKG